MAMSDTHDDTAGGQDESDLGQTLVLNGLRDLIEDTEHVLGSADSRTILEDAFESATTPEQRSRFESALPSAAEERPDETATETIETVVEAVVAELLDRDVTARLEHRTQVSLASRDVAVYNFARSGDVSALDRIDAEATVVASLQDGARSLLDGQFDEAVQQFEAAIDEGGTSDGAIAARVLAGLAQHRAGRDERAQDYVEEALHLDTGTWSATMVGMAAGADAPDLFRDGTQRVGAYFRARIERPETTGISASIRTGDTPEALTEAAWDELDGSPRYYEVDRLDQEVAIRLELSGSLDALPVIHAYYLTLGVIDVANETPRTAEHLFLTGPEQAPTSETVFFEAD